MFCIYAGIFEMFMPITYAQDMTNSLSWGIETQKEDFFPGEPVLLTVKIENTGPSEAMFDFGVNGLEAFSIAVTNISSEIVAQGGHIYRDGASMSGKLFIDPGQTIEKSIVLNQWCSTLLPPGHYTVVCRVEKPGDFYSEKIPIGNSESYMVVTKRRYLPMVTLELPIRIADPNDAELAIVFKQLAECAFTDAVETNEEVENRELAREMIVFSDSEPAIPYQLDILKVSDSTRVKTGAINSLAKSETLQAAVGLIDFYEDTKHYKADVKHDILEAVWKLRESGKPEIIEATNDFAEKYKPVN